MPTIALFDDRKSIRDALALNFKIALPGGWDFIPSAPLPNAADYVDWIVRNDVQVLVIDWVLDEQGGDVDHPVNYKGHVVVQTIRKQLPGIPVFVITAQPTDEDLTEHLGDVESVFTRQQFSSAPKKFIKPMIRAGERFAKQFADDLAELAALAEKVATGKITKDELARLRAIQATLGLIPDVQSEVSRSTALDNFEKKLGEMKTLGDEIGKYLKGNKRS
jgi:CheY-like chemotaxis protein